MTTVRELELARLRSMRPGEKVEAMESLRRQAWDLTVAGMRLRHPDWSEEQILAAVREAWRLNRDA